MCVQPRELLHAHPFNCLSQHLYFLLAQLNEPLAMPRCDCLPLFVELQEIQLLSQNFSQLKIAQSKFAASAAAVGTLTAADEGTFL